ncbi:hypothetical protein R3P38DRAFT_1376866 [Favolaschia claudopus]|uniref:Uncharacterized protein n=1 Tax=Favolaschia claudopus TaxID=2862362 RepID=A0AAW0DZ91_9AGAR
MANNVSINVAGGTGGDGGISSHGFAGGGGLGQGPTLNQHLYAYGSSGRDVTTAQNRSLASASEIYTSEMLLQKRGYPLFCPAPQAHHPNMNGGIAIGDVGCITSEGGFDYLFNVFSSANAHCPDGFDPLKLDNPNRLNTSLSEVERDDIDPGAYFSSTVQHENGDPMEYIFHCSSTHGAMLTLPCGAQRQQLKNGVKSLRRYAIENARSWYRYIDNDLGRDIDNGDLFLVTGHEKVRSWGMAHYSEHQFERSKVQPQVSTCAR